MPVEIIHDIVYGVHYMRYNVPFTIKVVLTSIPFVSSTVLLFINIISCVISDFKFACFFDTQKKILYNKNRNLHFVFFIHSKLF